jgi:hypothetical protein
MGSATTSPQFIRQVGAALGVSAFVLAATLGGFQLGLLLMIAVSAGNICVCARAARAQSPRCTPNRCFRIGNVRLSSPARPPKCQMFRACCPNTFFAKWVKNDLRECPVARFYFSADSPEPLKWDRF